MVYGYGNGNGDDFSPVEIPTGFLWEWRFPQDSYGNGMIMGIEISFPRRPWLCVYVKFSGFKAAICATSSFLRPRIRKFPYLFYFLRSLATKECIQLFTPLLLCVIELSYQSVYCIVCFLLVVNGKCVLFL